MKVLRSAILVAFLTIGMCLQAQTSITSSDMPQAGDTLRYSIAAPDSSVLLNFNLSGANQVWRFDSLQATRQGVANFKSSGQTPYSSVPSRLAELIADTLIFGGASLYDVYDFYNNSSSEFAIDYRGFSAPTGLPFPFPTVIRESPAFLDKDEVYQFPLSYLDRDSSTFDFTYSNPTLGVYLSQAGYRINNVEAYGSITTPYGTFNCIKVVTDIVSYDTLSFGTTNFGNNSHQREIKWLSPQVEIPVANLSGSVVAGVFIPGTIEYRDSVRNGVPNLFAPLAIFNADTTVVNPGDTVSFANNTLSITPPSYQWSITPNTGWQYTSATNATSESPVVIFNNTGFYDVQLVATNSRGADTLLIPSYIEVKMPVGLESSAAPETEIKIFPNPIEANQSLSLRSSNPIKEIRLISLDGKELIQKLPANPLVEELKLQGISKGIYIIQIELENTTKSKKIIIR